MTWTWPDFKLIDAFLTQSTKVIVKIQERLTRIPRLLYQHLVL